MPRTIRLTLGLALVAVFGILGTPPTFAQPDEERSVSDSIAGSLVAHGFEHVAVETGENLVSVWFENRIYRYDMTSLGVVAALAGAGLDADTVLELIPENRGVPVTAVSAPAGQWLAFLDGRVGENDFRSQLQIRLGSRRNGAPLAYSGDTRQNPAYLRTDFAVRPIFGFTLGIGFDVFSYNLSLAPELTMSPFHGGLITLQVAIALHDDFETKGFDPVQGRLCTEAEPCGRTVKPVRNTISWGGWLPGNWLAATSAGIFPGDRYGFSGQVGRLFLDGQLDVWAKGDLTGLLEFKDDHIAYSNLEQWTAYGAVTHRLRGLDLESTLRAGRFREGRAAVRFDLERRYKEFEAGFFGAKNKDETVFGFTLRIPLPVKHYSDPARFRLVTVPAFPFVYEDKIDASVARPVGFVALEARQFDDLDRLRKRLYPTFIMNNIEDLRLANAYLPAGDAP